MRKHLHRIGNSYGIIIDKPIRRVLGIGSRSVLEVSTDGERILIERTGELLEDDEIPRARHVLAAQEDASVRAQHVTAKSPGAKNAATNRKLLQADMEAVSQDFRRLYHPRPDQLHRLHHDPAARYVQVLSWLSAPYTARDATDEELTTLLRMRHCRDQLRSGCSWDQAIEAALQAYPMRCATSSNAVGTHQQQTSAPRPMS